jgi:hypothetical protein
MSSLSRLGAILAIVVAVPGLWPCRVIADDGGTTNQVTITNMLANSIMVQAGTNVTIRMDQQEIKRIYADRHKEQSTLPVHFRWQKDGEDIPGATDLHYTITNVSFEDAASYTLVLSGYVELQTAPVHLSVYTLFEAHSNGGTLAVPISDFTSGTLDTCGATGFDSYKTYLTFYGPNASPQSGTFVNSSHENNLDITTCTNVNGTTMKTAVQIQGNWSGMPIVGCSASSDCTANPNLSFATTPLSTNSSSSNTYRTTIYVKSRSMGTVKKVTWTWFYHN